MENIDLGKENEGYSASYDTKFGTQHTIYKDIEFIIIKILRYAQDDMVGYVMIGERSDKRFSATLNYVILRSEATKDLIQTYR